MTIAQYDNLKAGDKIVHNVTGLHYTVSERIGGYIKASGKGWSKYSHIRVYPSEHANFMPVTA